MPLKLVRRPKSPNWIMRGTIRGQYIEETTGTAEKEVANTILAKRHAELLEQSVYGKEFTTTFEVALLSYLEFDGERRYVQPLLDLFAARPLRKIGQADIDKAAQILKPNASAATRNRQVYTPMSAILRHAARRGWCVMPNLERPAVKVRPPRWITTQEARRLIQCSPNHLRALVVFLLLTGARAGEALWLDWSNVDLDNLRQVTFPKTKNGEARSVPLNSYLIAELRKIEHRKGLVFLTHQGKPYSRPDPDDDWDTSAGSRIKTAFKSACLRAGIKDFTPHCCRHTWATWHYQKNRDLTALQKLGGWKSIAMVLRYAHTNVSEHAQSVEKLTGGISGEWFAEEEKTLS